MRNATVSELKDQLSKYLRFVKEGETIVVLDRGVPVAEIQPRSRKKTASRSRLQALEARGILHMGDAQKMKKFAFPSEKSRTGVINALLEERRTGR